MVSHPFNSSTREAKAGEFLWLRGQLDWSASATAHMWQPDDMQELIIVYRVDPGDLLMCVNGLPGTCMPGSHRAQKRVSCPLAVEP